MCHGEKGGGGLEERKGKKNNRQKMFKYFSNKKDWGNGQRESRSSF